MVEGLFSAPLGDFYETDSNNEVTGYNFVQLQSKSKSYAKKLDAIEKKPNHHGKAGEK